MTERQVDVLVLNQGVVPEARELATRSLGTRKLVSVIVQGGGTDRHDRRGTEDGAVAGRMSRAVTAPWHRAVRLQHGGPQRLLVRRVERVASVEAASAGQQVRGIVIVRCATTVRCHEMAAGLPLIDPDRRHLGRFVRSASVKDGGREAAGTRDRVAIVPLVATSDR